MHGLLLSWENKCGENPRDGRCPKMNIFNPSSILFRATPPSSPSQPDILVWGSNLAGDDKNFPCHPYNNVSLGQFLWSKGEKEKEKVFLKPVQKCQNGSALATTYFLDGGGRLLLYFEDNKQTHSSKYVQQNRRNSTKKRPISRSDHYFSKKNLRAIRNAKLLKTDQQHFKKDLLSFFQTKIFLRRGGGSEKKNNLQQNFVPLRFVSL